MTTLFDLIHKVPGLLPSHISIFCGLLAFSFLILAIIKRSDTKLCFSFQIISIVGAFGFMPFAFKVLLT